MLCAWIGWDCVSACGLFSQFLESQNFRSPGSLGDNSNSSSSSAPVLETRKLSSEVRAVDRSVFPPPFLWKP